MVCGEPGSRSSLVARQSGHGQAIPAQSVPPGGSEGLSVRQAHSENAATWPSVSSDYRRQRSAEQPARRRCFMKHERRR